MSAAGDEPFASVLGLLLEGRQAEAADAADTLVTGLAADAPPVLTSAALTLAAATRRPLDPVRAARSARRAVRLAQAGSAASAGAHRELGAALVACGRAEEAVPVLRRAVSEAGAAGLGAASTAQVEVHLALALAACGDADGAVTTAAATIGVDGPALLDLVRQAAGDLTDAPPVGAEKDDQTPLEKATGEVFAAILTGDAATARSAAVRARALAWEVRDRDAYVLLAGTEADLAEAAGDRVGAYAALAIGWRTFDEELGAGRGREAFAAGVAEQITRWGRPAYDAAAAAFLADR